MPAPNLLRLPCIISITCRAVLILAAAGPFLIASLPFTATAKSCFTGTCGVNATCGSDDPDIFDGSEGDDLICGFGGADIIKGNKGLDSLSGGDGDDDINGNQGSDDLNGGAGIDTIHGGKDNDRIRGGDGADKLFGDLGDDELFGDAGDDIELFGGPGNDRIRGGKGNDELFGEDGDDKLWGDGGDDMLFGGPGNDDYIYRPGNPDNAVFTDGNDTIEDTEGSNRIFLMRIEQSNVSVSGDGDDLLIQMNLPGMETGSIRIVGCLSSGGDCLADGTFEIIYNPINVVFIMADDLGYADLGSYGQQTIATPRLDEMAAEGIRFTSFYSGAPLCAPSRNSLMAGLHTGHTRVRANSGAILEPVDAVLSSQLKTRGYWTGMFGKWGMGSVLPVDPPTQGLPHQMGFDEFVGFISHRDAHVYFHDSPPAGQGTSQHPHYDNVRQELFTIANGQTVPLSVPPDRYLHDEFMDRALDFITRHADEPFFLYLPVAIPHAELAVPDLVLGRPQDAEPSLPGYELTVPDDNPWAPTLDGNGYDRHNLRPNATYAAMITRLDSDVGELLDLLDAEGLADTTVVFFTSDNGPHSAGGMKRPPDVFNSNGVFRGGTATPSTAGGKFTLWEGGIRVPMIVRWPGTVAIGVTNEPAALWDIVPTVAEIAGTPPPAGGDGISILPLLQGQPQTPHDFLYWEALTPEDTVQAVRTGRWKAVRRDLGATDVVELYDLQVDPGETCNVVDPVEPCFDPAQFATLNDLKLLMNAEHVPSPSDPSDGQIPDLVIDALLSVTKTGLGGGMVQSTGGEIDCGAVCFALFPALATVTLNAQVEPGSTFAGWSGPCSGNGSCVFVIGSDTTAVANFDTTCGDGVLQPFEQCDDGNTVGGDCCTPTCQLEANGSPCSDSLFCNGADVCLAGVCSRHAGDPCPGADGDGNCAETCDDGSDSCTGLDPNGSICDDANVCTVSDTCSAGACGGPSLDCDDGDACTADSCDELLGCAHEPIEGCSTPVPSLGGWSWILLAGLILSSGTLAVRSQRRAGA